MEFYRHKNNNDDGDDRPTDQVSNRERHVPPNREKKNPNNSRGEIPETFHCPSKEWRPGGRVVANRLTTTRQLRFCHRKYKIRTRFGGKTIVR